MRRLQVFVGVLLLCGLLFGCGKPDVPPATEPPTTEPPAATQPEMHETVPVSGKNTVYFSNALEYERLYGLDPDTGELFLILDEACYHVTQQGDLVYFIVDGTLYAWNTVSGQRKTLQEDVESYAVEGDALLYSRYADYRLEFYWRNMVTGEEKELCTVDFLILATKGSRAYYVARDYEADRDMICTCDLLSGNTQVLYQTQPDHYIYSEVLLATEEGLLFHEGSYNETKWLCVKPDGTVRESPWQLSGFNCEPIAQVDGGLLYLHHEYADHETSQLRCLAPSGEETVLAQSDEGAYYQVHPLREDLWLLQQSAHISWGPYSEYGYQENYSYQTEYALLHADGTLEPLDAKGVLGSLFADGDFPVIDSSTARKPVTAELCNIFVKNHGYEGAEPVCSTTHGAWLNIADGGADLALLAAPTPEEQAYLTEKGVEVEMKLYGGDGLVFIGNPENPVKNLTHEQLLAIYRKEITNWKEVGGPDAPITVYYRDDQSGSQRLFEKLVWKGEEIPDFGALGFRIEDAMSSIVDMVQWDPYAIGYTIMTYLDDVYGEDSLRVFAINGVVPSPETIADGSYAYHTQGYLVIRTDEPENSPARRLYDWFGCPVSDELLRICGVTPLHG